jgi:hypothetical protein
LPIKSKMSGPQPFVILGHGSEDVTKEFEERAKLGEGYTLVTLAECGVVTMLTTVNRFLDAFAEPANREIFANPAAPANKARIQSILGNKIHVYRPGNLYPDLSVQAIVDWSSEEDAKPTEIDVGLFKSGLYPFPMDPALLVEPRVKVHTITGLQDHASFIMRHIVPQAMAPDLLELYDGSLFPTRAQVDEALTSSRAPSGRIRFAKFKEAMTFPLSKFMELGGPGVYFYVICRSPKEVPVREWVETYITQETEAKKALVKNFKEKANVIPLIPHILPNAKSLEERERARLAAEGGKEKWNTANLTESHNKFKKLYNVAMRTRGLSNAQQAEINAALAGAGAGPAAGAGGGGPPNQNEVDGGSRRRHRHRKMTRRHYKKRGRRSCKR